MKLSLKNIGKIITARVSNPSVLENDIIAEIIPLLSAVKNEDA